MARLGRLAVALVLLAALPAATGAEPQRERLTGQLLIAAPELADPNFFHAVVLIVKHDGDGAMGVIVNRPADEVELAELMRELGLDDTDAAGKVRIFSGGPVEPRIGLVLHSAEYRRDSTIDIDGRIALTSSVEILRDIARAQGPRKSLFAFGNAGWGPGQLESEMAAHAWFTAPDDPKLVFDEAPGRIWQEALDRRTRDL